MGICFGRQAGRTLGRVVGRKEERRKAHLSFPDVPQDVTHPEAQRFRTDSRRNCPRRGWEAHSHFQGWCQGNELHSLGDRVAECHCRQRQRSGVCPWSPLRPLSGWDSDSAMVCPQMLGGLTGRFGEGHLAESQENAGRQEAPKAQVSAGNRT